METPVKKRPVANAYYISIGAISIFVASYNIAIISVALKPVENAFHTGTFTRDGLSDNEDCVFAIHT